jgi:ABC-type glycerol-3-phosphate transport system substrate-binding protein
MTTPSRALRRRAVAAALAGALVFAACGGGDDSAASGDAASAGTQAPTPPDDVDLDPASDTPANQLPDVVVDDLQLGNKVNLRNFAPSDTPILLWMWAPH